MRSWLLDVEQEQERKAHLYRMRVVKELFLRSEFELRKPLDEEKTSITQCIENVGLKLACRDYSKSDCKQLKKALQNLEKKLKLIEKEEENLANQYYERQKLFFNKHQLDEKFI